MLSPQQSMKNTVFKVKEKLSKSKENLVEQDTDCDVSFDESWQKRGYLSKNGIVSVISNGNGKVLDLLLVLDLLKTANHADIGKRKKRHMTVQ